MLKSKLNVKKILSLFLLAMILISAYNFQSLNVKAAETEKKILVLIKKDKEWIAYQNMVIKSPKNNLMLKANPISKKLDLTYKNVNSKKFTIRNGNKTLTFTKRATNYQYKNGSSIKNYKNTYTPYTAKVDGTSYNLIHYNSLSKLVNAKYFSTKGTEFQKQGYTGVIVLSKTEKISELPKTKTILDEKGKAFFVPTSFPTKVPDKEPTKEPTKTPDKEPTKEPEKTPSPTPPNTDKPSNEDYITIGGIKVPVVSEGFKNPSDTKEGAFGNDNRDNNIFDYYDATQKFNSYIQSSIEDIGEYVEADAAKVVYTDNFISISFFGDHTNQTAMTLSKNGSQYELTLKTAIYNGSKYDKVAQNSLKLLLASFTNEIDTLYKAIYSEWEGNNDYGINKESFVTIGSCKVKYANGGTYIIKAK